MKRTEQKPGGQSFEVEQTITQQEHIKNRMPSDHVFKGRGERCDWCGRVRSVHLLNGTI